jgi:hypothetical protein
VGTPVGTNHGLLLVLWMLVSGALLVTRGAVIPGLEHIGLTEAETRRALPPLYRGRGRPPTRGALVRPLARRRRRGGGLLAATPPDVVETWRVEETPIRVEG